MNPTRRYARWPISFGFARYTSTKTLGWHGWWIKGDLYGRTIHIGPIKVYFGRLDGWRRRP